MRHRWRFLKWRETRINGTGSFVRILTSSSWESAPMITVSIVSSFTSFLSMRSFDSNKESSASEADGFAVLISSWSNDELFCDTDGALRRTWTSGERVEDHRYLLWLISRRVEVSVWECDSVCRGFLPEWDPHRWLTGCSFVPQRLTANCLFGSPIR